MKQLIFLAPEIFLSTLALALLVGEAFAPRQKMLWIRIGLVGLGIVLLHQIAFFATGAVPGAASLGLAPAMVKDGWVQYGTVFGMMAIDSLAAFFKLTIVAGVMMVLWLSIGYRELEDTPIGSYVSLLLLATVGMMFLVASSDLLM